METLGIVLFFLFIIIAIIVFVAYAGKKYDDKTDDSSNPQNKWNKPQTQNSNKDFSETVKNRNKKYLKFIESNNGKIKCFERFNCPDSLTLKFYSKNDSVLKQSIKELTRLVLKHIKAPEYIGCIVNVKTAENQEHITNPANISGNKITIYLIPDWDFCHYAAAICHECTHYYLLSRNIKMDNENDNEKLTDIMCIFLGFGSIVESAYKPRYTLGHTRTLGYIDADDVKYIKQQYSLKYISQMIKDEEKYKRDEDERNKERLKVLGKRICSNCKYEMPITNIFCKRCGFENEKIILEKRICSSCKNEIPVSDIFCRKCGFEDKPVEVNKNAWW